MAITVKYIEQMRSYFSSLMGRADHHAENVNEIALALVGAIIWRMDEDQPIKVFDREGEAKNVLWAHLGGQRYAFSYNRTTQCIDMRKDNLRGTVIGSFSNTTSLAYVKQLFESL